MLQRLLNALVVSSILGGATSAVADLPDDVRHLSGLLAEQATRASLKIDAQAEAVRIKGVFEDALNEFARANHLMPVITVQTFADKKQIGVSFATVSNPTIMVQVAARNGQLLIEQASCGDETLVSYDSRTKVKELAEDLKRMAQIASLLDKQPAERLRAEVEPAAKNAQFTLEMMHELGFCSIMAKRPGLTIHAWALNGEGHVSTDYADD